MYKTLYFNHSKHFVRFAKSLSILIFSILVFNSCKKDLLISKDNHPPATDFRIEKITYNGFIDNINVNALGVLKPKIASSNHAKLLSLSDHNALGNLSIYTDSIKRIINNNDTSYVFQMALTSPRATSFRNLTINTNRGKVSAFIATYTPTKEWVEARKANRPIPFKGDISFATINLNGSTMFQALSSENFTPAGNHKVMSGGNKKMVALDVCNDFVVYAVSTYGCSQGNHMPGDDACAWNNGGTVPDGEYRAGYTYTAVTVQVCHTVNYPDPEGGGNSGGGGTTPNPPGDYDPCKDAVPTAAYVNNSSGLKLAVVAPSPCDEGGGGKLPIIDDETPSQFAIELQLFINELQISDASLVSFLANNKNIFNTLNNYLITNGKTIENKEFVEWAAGYLYTAPTTWTAFNDVFFSGPKDLIFENVSIHNIAAPLYTQSDYSLSGVASYFTEGEIENVINNLSNDFNDEPIQLYLIACYKNSKLLNSSLYSTSNSLKIGDYTVTPHYNAQGTLVFYSAWRAASLGIEYLIKTSALNDFQNNHTFYRAAANLFYVNGKPSYSQIQMGAGDYWEGLRTAYEESLNNPQYYVYLIHVLVGTATNLKTIPNTNQPIKIRYTSVTRSNAEYPSIQIENISIAEYRNAIGQKYNTIWQSLGDGKFRLEVGQNRYMSYPSATSTGKPTIEYFRNDKSIGKFRFYN